MGKLTSKRSRSVFFLMVTMLLILMINGFMPIISGQAHYTVNPVEVSHGEYEAMRSRDENYMLTYASVVKIELYKELYILANEDLSPAERLTIEVPDELPVKVNTEFFFRSGWWYATTAISTISAILLFYALFYYYIVKDKEEDVSYVNASARVDMLVRNHIDPDTFEPWMDVEFNRSRKVDQHIRNVKHEIQRLEDRTPYAVKKPFLQYFNAIEKSEAIPEIGGELNRKQRRYQRKKEALYARLDKSYIESIVYYARVKNYREIKPGFVYTGVNRPGVLRDEYSEIKTDSQQVRQSLYSKILLSFSIVLAFASLFTMLAVDIEEQSTWWIVGNVIARLIPLFLQFYFALNYREWFMNNQLLMNLKHRENIALLYHAKMQKLGIKVQPIVVNEIVLKEKEKK